MNENTIDKVSELWNYAEEKVGEENAIKLLSHLGFDNPFILKQYTTEKCKNLIDKYLIFNKILNKKENDIK